MGRITVFYNNMAKVSSHVLLCQICALLHACE